MRTLTSDQARRIVVRAARLNPINRPSGLPGARAELDHLGEIQLDPIDRIGTNADLVLHARVDGLTRGDWARLPDTFEHFAKERCLLPGRRFPWWRDHTAVTPWWRLSQRLKRLDSTVLDAVLEEVRKKGPVAAADLSDHGRVRPLDWSGWKGTGKAATMALEVLATRCQVVVTTRNRSGQRVHDIPDRALPKWAKSTGGDFFQDGLRQRVQTAGLLRTAGGPQWSALAPCRGGRAVDALIQDGELEVVSIEGSRRRYLVGTPALDTMEEPLETDDRVRILGPLDPLLWDRDLVRLAMGFDYVWEVYKPAHKRKWGYYVCPLYWRGQLVGRIEATRGKGAIEVEQLWWEACVDRPPRRAVEAMLARLWTLQARPVG